MESLARGLSVIRAFGGARRALSCAEVAVLTGLSRAAARRCLHTLTVLGYVSASGGTYELTAAVRTLADGAPGPAALATVAQPVLDRLSARIEEASGVAVLDGDDVVFLARASARRLLSLTVTVGSRLPAACTSSGRVLLAFGDPAAAARFIARAALPRHTARTIVDRKELRAEIARVRRQGYAIVDQELELGLRSLAVPIRRPDGVVIAALNVGVQAGRVDVRRLRELLPALQAAAGEIGSRQ